MDRFNYHNNYVPATQAVSVFFERFMKGKRQIPEWAILAIILAVALIAVISIVALRQHADESRQVEALLSRLKGESYHLDALEWQFERKSDPEVLQEVQQVENEIAQTSNELMLLDPGEGRLQQIQKAQLEFETNMDEEIRSIAAGNSEKMENLDKEKVDPSFNALSDQIANTSAIYRERAQRAQMESNIGTAIIVISAGTIIGFLILKFQKMQLKAKLIETEQKVLRKAHDELETQVQDRTAELTKTNKILQDEITERKRMEGELRDREHFLANTFASIQDGIGVIDKDMNIIRVNPTAERWYPHAAPLVGKKCYEAYHDRSERCEICPSQETFKTGKSDYRIIHKSGPGGEDAGWLEIYSFPMVDTATGQIGWVIEYVRDITERKRIEEELQKSIHQQTAILNSIPDLAWLKDKECRFIAVNKPFAEACGVSPEDLVGKTDFDIWHKDLAEGYRADDREVMEIGRRKQVEEPLIDKDGRKTWIETIKTPIYNEQGEVIGTTGIARDVTERKRMEESLKLLSEAIEEAPDGVQIVDLSGHIIYSNKAVEEIYGFSPAEYKGKHVNEMNVDPEFASSVILPSIKETGRWVGELMVKHKDGRAFPILLTTSMVRNSKDEPIAIVGIISDITERKRMIEELRRAHDELELRVQERTAELVKTNEILQAEITERKSAEEALKQSEEKYHTLIDNIQDGVFIIQDGKMQFVNEAFARIVGYTVEEVTGKDVMELVAPEDLEMVADLYRRRQAGEDVPHEYEFHGIKKDGTRTTVNMNVGLITYNGRLASMGTVKDITEKKRLESQLLRAQRMESIGTLASGIAHDINNVLTPIMLSQQLLQEKLTDEESQRLLNTIERSTQRGANLMKQVQSFTKGVESEHNVLQIANLVFEIRQIAKETFPRNIEIKTNIPKDLWTISGDATQLHQVIMNLCVNARDAMPDGGILSITASNFPIDENYAKMNTEAKIGAHIVITVSDTGTGIPPEVMDRIFEPFFTTKEHGKGTGLGLSTSHGIVKSHGGFINVYSEVGRGTAFKVYLPAITTSETLNEEEQQHELLIGHGESILVVDDEDQIREITRKILETHGYKVITASDGKEAIALYSQHRGLIKAVIMDMMMPVMDGLSCIRELYKANTELKVIAVSGLAEMDKFAKVDDAHIQAFLSKPYATEKLLSTIHDIINTNPAINGFGSRISNSPSTGSPTERDVSRGERSSS